MILLWGLPGDPPLAAVLAALREQHAEVAFLDEHKILETEVEFDGTLAGAVRMPGTEIDLAQIRAVYLRPYDLRRLPAVSETLLREGIGGPAFRHALAVEDALLSWCEVTRALVLNRPSYMASNSSKPYQSFLIRSQGFRIPETLITTDPEAAREFCERHREVIYKSISGVRSIVTRMTEKDLSRLDDVRWCPTQFQAWVTGEDYRVHVVGEEVFACRITSAAADYRYARSQGADLKIEAYKLPEDLSDACCRLAKFLGLGVAGIDLRRTPEGTWYCFEANPSPGFTFYQESTGQLIDSAIAELLVTSTLKPAAPDGVKNKL